MKRRFKHSDIIIVIALVILFTVIIAANARLVSKTLSSQTKRVGETQLSSIKSDLENYISESENALLKTASGAEQIIASGRSMDALGEYIVRQKKLQLETSGGTNFNVYIAGQGWAIIPDFDMPSDYHATERLWYVGAVEAAGEIYITDPYIDSMTGDMCYTLSVLLSDNDTVVAMDFTLTEIQRFIDKMASGTEATSGALIVTDEGMIVGYNDMSYVGKSIKKDLTQYSYIVSYIISYPDENSFVDEVDGKKCRIFHSDTRNGWHMILAVYYDELFGNTARQIVINIITSVIMLLLIVILYIRNAGNRNKTEEALRSRERFVEKLSDNLREPLGEVIRLSDADIANSSDEVRENLSLIKTAGIRMDEMMKDLSSYSTIVSDMNKEDRAKKTRSKNLSKKIRVLRNAIIVLLIFVTFISSFTLYDAYRSQANENVKRQLTKYNADFNVWETEQKTILHMFTNYISAQPEILDDYEGAVKWLDSIAVNYPSISVCYMANPYKEHTVIMNNGWQPEEGWKVEEREWYKQTERSPEGLSFSKPYFDEQTGNYCITISEMVYGKNGEFLGIFGIDLYMDRIIEIFGSGYTDYEYVFLVDPNGDIINHPNAKYQMSMADTTNINDTPYKKVYKLEDGESLNIKDYNGSLSMCNHVYDKSTGFSIFYVTKWWTMNLLNLVVIGIFVVLVGACTIIIILLMNKVIRSQAEMNTKLSKAVEEATVAGKAKSDFLAQMSHEIRTPINAIIGMDEMILREASDSEITEYAHNIKNASSTLLTLINGILDFSKIESGKMEIISGKYETNAMIDNLVNMISDKAEKKGLTFNVDIDPNLPKQLYGDDVRIRQVITNILTNAVKYTNRGSVTMTMKVYEVSEDDCTLYVEVKDTGIGIREEDMDKLFASFQRLDEKRNKNIEGTGLGMSIVEGLLSMMGSKLKVESTYGKGSTFSFMLSQKIIDSTPIGEYVKGAGSSEEKASKRREFTLKNAAVLVVDDNDMNLKVAKGLMKRMGMVPDLASSGESCIDMIKEKRYDIILMDHMMPVMDGIETLAKINKEGLLRADTVVIALTANAVVGAREMYLEKGFKDYLSKPIDPEQLEDMFIKYLPEGKIVYKDALTTETVVASDDIIDDATTETTEKDSSAVKAVEDNSSAQRKKDDDRSFVELLCEKGFNTEAALGYAMDDEDFYKELLETYIGEEGDKRADIRKNYEEKNWHEYQILVHALKSSSRTIGADELSEKALAQEMATKNGDTDVIHAGYDEMMSDYEAVMEMIRDVLA